MKKTVKVLIQIIILFFLSIPTMAADKEQVAIVVVEHWPPWEIAHDAKKRNVTDGLAVEIVKILFNRLNIKVKFFNAPWKRALLMIEKGTSDLIPMLSRNTEREAYMVFTIPVYKEPILFAYSTDKFKAFEWKRWADLKHLQIGVTRGYSYGNFDEVIKKHKLRTQTVTTDRQNVFKLLAGRIDITPLHLTNAVSMFNKIQENDRLKLKFAKKPINENIYYFGISKKSFLAIRLPEIDKSLQEMQNDGTFKKILGEFYKPI
ncbi:MAG: amino acid ABC transporter substrate-binding protein [Deltaproteobacteria bacterium]|nr:amino acid ABC transporter substrate-binding protein [Deltaproteobacteria bacterium]